MQTTDDNHVSTPSTSKWRLATYALEGLLVISILGVGAVEWTRHEVADPSEARGSQALAFMTSRMLEHDFDATKSPLLVGNWVRNAGKARLKLSLRADRSFTTTRSMELSGQVIPVLSSGSYIAGANDLLFVFDSVDEGSQHGNARIVENDESHLVLKNPETGAVTAFVKEAS